MTRVIIGQQQKNKFVLGLIAECIQQTDTNNATKRPADQIILLNSTCKVVLDLSRD